MLYTIVKSLHISAAVVSGLLFSWRGLRALLGYKNNGFALKILPHIIDTVLLGCGLYLAWRSSQYPFVSPWLTAKVIVLVIYILLGRQALKANQAFVPRLFYFITAVAAYLYIIGTAHYRNVWSWLALYF